MMTDQPKTPSTSSAFSLTLIKIIIREVVCWNNSDKHEIVVKVNNDIHSYSQYSESTYPILPVPFKISLKNKNNFGFVA